MNRHISMEPLALNQVKVKDAFWGRYMKLVREEAIPYQWEVMNDRIPGIPKSHAIENFRIAAGLSEGEFHGYVFQDSDVAKWLEAVAYRLTTNPDPELEKTADEVIELIGKAQQPDGYLNTYFTIKDPEMRWKDERRKHELYCAGHMMEAAVAYYEATGKRKLLNAMERFADHIEKVFGSEPGMKKGYPGHQVIEMALVRMYQVTGEERYLRLSRYFIDERGRQPHFFDIEEQERGEKGHIGYFEDYVYKYTQSHKPVREQMEAVGHAVRAVYLYSGMADVAAETGDDSLVDACKRLWDNVTKRQMYITGGIGSQSYGEDFTFDYDLPNDTLYAESCASVGLVFFAHRMLHMEADSRYADIMEQTLYNGVLSGMSLDGKSYFYVNPLEVWTESCKNRHDKRHVETTRQGWFGCACCPPNIARLLASIGKYIYSANKNTVFTHLFIGSSAEVEINGQKVQISQESNYPWDGRIMIRIEPAEDTEFTMAVRIPGWCTNAGIRVNEENVNEVDGIEKGYAYITRKWSKGSLIELNFHMPVRRVHANPQLREDAGKVAIMRGPVVYCLEQIDNTGVLADFALPENPEFKAEFEGDLLGGVVTIKAEAAKSKMDSWNDELYRELDFAKAPAKIKAVPYYAWNNRGEGDMLVWIRQLNL